jgi:quinol monooxygenase YgiN
LPERSKQHPGTSIAKGELELIHVIATIQIKPGRRGEFLEHFHRVVPLVRAEQGCVEYGPTVGVHTEISAQEAVDPDVVVVVERWESLESLNAHLAAPHMLQYRESVADLVARPAVLQILESA